MRTDKGQTYITPAEALEMIQDQDGRVFGVEFIKKTDGSLRKMSCRRHAVDKAIEKNKTGRKQGPNADPYMVKVWDMNKVEDPENPEASKGAFRTINVHTLQTLSINGVKFQVETEG